MCKNGKARLNCLQCSLNAKKRVLQLSKTERIKIKGGAGGTILSVQAASNYRGYQISEMIYLLKDYLYSSTLETDHKSFICTTFHHN